MRREIEGSVKSKGRREVEVEKTADWLFLPQESLSNRAVRGYVEVVRDVKALRKQFKEESAREKRPILMEFSVTETYKRVDRLLAIEENMLSYGLRETPNIRDSVHDAVYSLGIRTVTLGVLNGEDPEGTWTTKVPQNDSSLDLPYIPPLERDDTFHRKRVEGQGIALGFAAEGLWNPSFQSFLTMVIDTKTLLKRQERAMKIPEEPGLTPSAPERLRAVSHVTRAAIMTLEESQEDPLDREIFMKELNPGIAVYDIFVEPIYSGSS